MMSPMNKQSTAMVANRMAAIMDRGHRRNPIFICAALEGFENVGAFPFFKDPIKCYKELPSHKGKPLCIKCQL